MNASNMLKPALARGELRAIGATTLKEYQKHTEKDPALTRRFQPVYVSEPATEDTIAILRGLKENDIGGRPSPAGPGLSLYAKSEPQPLGDERRSEDAQLAAVTEELQAPSLPLAMPLDRTPEEEVGG